MGFVVASAALRDVLSSAPRAGRVVAVLPVAVYLEISPAAAVDEAGPGGRLVALLARDAVRVPIGLVTAVRRQDGPFGGVRPGDPARIGDGELRVGAGPDAVAHRPLRYWDPQVPRLGARLVGAEVRRRAEALADLADALGPEALGPEALGPEALGPEVTARWAAAAAPLERALAAPSPTAAAVQAAVEPLIGLGPGLTPAGDDVLAGVLVTLAAAGEGLRLEALRGAIAAAGGPERTTPLSAALLAEAGHGRAVPEVVALLRALAGSGDLDVARGRMARVGHTSGAALALGIRSALRALDGGELGKVA